MQTKRCYTLSKDATISDFKQLSDMNKMIAQAVNEGKSVCIEIVEMERKLG